MAAAENVPDLVELKNMVMSFRVSELQMLLRSAERNKSGRKHDLMTRALQLVKNGCSTQIQTRIRELYHIRFPRAKSSHISSHSKDKDSYETNGRGEVNGMDHTPSNQLPVHPKVRFKPLPFYEVVSDVLKPASLISRANRAYSKTEMTFILSEEQVEAICKSTAKDNMRKFNASYQVQVQLRFCLLETTCEQKDVLPPNLTVKVNHHQANLPPFIPPSKAGVEPKRCGRPIELTLLCRLSHVSYNQIEVSWSSEYGKNYAMCINVVRQQTSDMLMQRLRRRGIRNAGHSRTLIKEKLTRDPDSEIATTSLKVSLQCPLGKMRMTVPARPVTCTHMQCFDAMLFLQMNEKKPTWICPVCNKPADFSNLFIDGLFMEILDATDCEEIVFLEDGEWQPFQEAKESFNLLSPKKAVALDLSNSVRLSPDGDKQKVDEVIDLTCDSSDEEETSISCVERRVEDRDKEQDEVHSLSSASPYRSDSGVIQVEDKRSPSKHSLQQESPWEPAKDLRRTPVLTPNMYSRHPSPKPKGYGPHDAAASDRSAQSSMSQMPAYSPAVRDSTPPISLGSVLNPNMPAYPSHMDYSTPSPLDFGSYSPFLLNPAFDPMRRMPTEHNMRSSPFSLNQLSSRLYPPTTRSSNEHVARSYYAPPYHPYSPLPFLPPSDPSALDIIPID